MPSEFRTPDGTLYTGAGATQMRRLYGAQAPANGAPGNPIPGGSALARLIAGQPFDTLEAKRDELRAAMVEFEAALDAAEQREERIARRARSRAGNRTADRVGRGAGGAR